MDFLQTTSYIWMGRRRQPLLQWYYPISKSCISCVRLPKTNLDKIWMDTDRTADGHTSDQQYTTHEQSQCAPLHTDSFRIFWFRLKKCFILYRHKSKSAQTALRENFHFMEKQIRIYETFKPLKSLQQNECTQNVGEDEPAASLRTATLQLSLVLSLLGAWLSRWISSMPNLQMISPINLQSADVVHLFYSSNLLLSQLLGGWEGELWLCVWVGVCFKVYTVQMYCPCEHM